MGPRGAAGSKKKFDNANRKMGLASRLASGGRATRLQSVLGHGIGGYLKGRPRVLNMGNISSGSWVTYLMRGDFKQIRAIQCPPGQSPLGNPAIT
jgi:hypothetical protein